MFALVITYRPDPDLLARNIACYANQAREVIIWQNTPLAERAQYPMPQLPNVVLMGEDDNVGLSRAFNTVLRYCQHKGCQHLLTMDQDSLFPHFPGFLARVSELVSLHPGAIAFGPEVNSHKLSLGQEEERPYLINSGTIIDVDKALAMGGFTEDFFLDGIDIDFGYKAHAHGHNIYCVGGFALQQSFGNTTQKAGIRYAAYPPHRLRGTVKAYWRIIRTYWPKTIPLILELLNRFYLRKTIAIILFQRDKWQKLKAIWLG